MNDTLNQKLDEETVQRRALAKVYSLLLKLAEEASVVPVAVDNPATQEKTQESSMKVHVDF